MRRLFFMALMITGMLNIHAYEYPYLVLQDSNGGTTTVAVDNLVITIVNGNLVATNDNGSQTFSLKDLNKMFFTQQADLTGITNTDTYDDVVEIYTTGGVALGKYENENTAKASLKPGLYILKSKSRTYKIAVK